MESKFQNGRVSMASCRTGRLKCAGNVLLILIIFVPFCGCDGAKTNSEQRLNSHLKTLISLYNASSRKIGRIPNDEAEFRKSIEETAGPVLERVGIASIDDLLISERDGKPFVVIYRKNRSRRVSQEIIAYEQEGLDGKRQVGLSLGAIELLDEARFRELVPTEGE